MNRLTKKYRNGIITLDADKFPNVGQETLDREIGAFAPFRRAVEALYEYEDAVMAGKIPQVEFTIGKTAYIIDPYTNKLRKGIIKEIHYNDDTVTYGIKTAALDWECGKFTVIYGLKNNDIDKILFSHVADKR